MKMIKYNKSEIMKDAWNLYRISIWKGNFSVCLKKAWEFAKQALNAAAKRTVKKINGVSNSNITFTFGEPVYVDAKVRLQNISRRIYRHRY